MRHRPLLFKWRHFEPQIIVCAVRWYLRFSPSYREVAELMMERAIQTNVNPGLRHRPIFTPPYFLLTPQKNRGKLALSNRRP